MSRSLPLALLTLVAGGALATAQPVKVKVAQAVLEEGRPATIRVQLENGSPRPVLLVSCEVTIEQEGRSVAQVGGDLTRSVQGISLEAPEEDPFTGVEAGDEDRDRVVTLTLRAIDDPGPAARLPLPDRVSTARGEEHRRVPLLVRRTEPIALRPLAGPVTVKVRWVAIPLPIETPPGVYELANERRWVPEARRGEAASEAGSRTLLRMTTRHWRRWRGDLRGELLLKQETYAGLPRYEGSTVQSLGVRRALFGRQAALRKAGLGSRAEAWRLSDERWILQDGERYALVGARQEARVGRGDLRAAAERLARGQSARFAWEGTRQHADLEVALKELFDAEAGHTKGGRRTLSWKVDARSLGPLLDLLGESELVPWGERLRAQRAP